MKNAISVLMISFTALAIIAIAIYGYADHGTLVPPPEAVSEGFLRSVASNRYSRAIPYLSNSLAASMDHDQLKEEFRSLSPGSGKLINVEAELEQLEGNSARTVGVIQSVENSRRVELRLVLESGVWKIDNFSPM